MTLHGLKWKPSSPSLYHLDYRGTPVAIGFTGRAWHIAVDNEVTAMEFPTRDAAAELVAQTYYGRKAT